MRIGVYLRAGYPLLLMETTEYPAAVHEIVMEIGRMPETTDKFCLAEWKITTGLMVGTIKGGTEKGTKEAEDPVSAALWVRDRKGKKAEDVQTVAIFHNIRQFINDPGMIQALIDASLQAKRVGSHIILLGPHFDIPLELRSYLTIVPFPLPDRSVLEDVLTELVDANADKIQFGSGTWREAYESITDANGAIVGQKQTPAQSQLVSDVAAAALGLPMMSAEAAFCLSFVVKNTPDRELVQTQKEVEVRKSDVLEFVRTEETMDSVGGFDELKRWLLKRKDAFGDAAREYGLAYPRGLLLVGIAGGGKSLAAKACAHYLGLPLLRLDMGKVFRALVGESEAAIRMALDVAERISPSILWMDELERSLAGSKSSGELDSGVTARVISTILTWRAETTKPVMLVATANDISSLPSMIYRKGRFDEVWSVSLPQRGERRDIFKIHLMKRGRDPEKFDVELLADQTDKWVGSEIEEAVKDAMFLGFSEGREFTTEDIMRAIRSTTSQAQRDPAEVNALEEWAATRARPVSSKEEEKQETRPVRHIRSVAPSDGGA